MPTGAWPHHPHSQSFLGHCFAVAGYSDRSCQRTQSCGAGPTTFGEDVVPKRESCWWNWTYLVNESLNLGLSLISFCEIESFIFGYKYMYIYIYIIFPHIGKVIPTDELRFFRGAGIPPTIFLYTYVYMVILGDFLSAPLGIFHGLAVWIVGSAVPKCQLAVLTKMRPESHLCHLLCCRIYSCWISMINLCNVPNTTSSLR